MNKDVLSYYPFEYTFEVPITLTLKISCADLIQADDVMHALTNGQPNPLTQALSDAVNAKPFIVDVEDLDIRRTYDASINRVGLELANVKTSTPRMYP